MPKTLVVFYSLSGNAKFMAETIAAAVGGEVLALETQKGINAQGPLKYLWGGMQVLSGAKPVLKPVGKNWADYDLIFIGSPVWAGSLAPALKSFIFQSRISGKKLALFCCFDGRPGRTFGNLKKALAGNEFLGELGLAEPLKNREINASKITGWAREIVSRI